MRYTPDGRVESAFAKAKNLALPHTTQQHLMKFAGIPLRLHWTFSFMLLLIFLLSWDEVFSPVLFTWNLLFVGSLFTCVVLHEYGHALTARRYGITTRDIILTPIGGIARLEGMPANPLHELAIAFAGPLVNFLIAGLLLFPVFYFFPTELQHLKSAFFTGQLEVEEELSVILRYWLPALLFLNIGLATFNLMPAFPMDGGRILRALLSLRWSRLRATRIASRLGQFAGLVFLFTAYSLSHPGLFFIGIFIIITATQEYRSLYQYESLKSQTAARLVQPFPFCLSANDSLAQAYDFLKQVKHKRLPVLDEGGKVLGHFELKGEPAEAEKGEPLFKHIRPWPARLFAEDDLLTAFQKMQSSRSNWLPVFDKDDMLLGFLDKKKLKEL